MKRPDSLPFLGGNLHEQQEALLSLKHDKNLYRFGDDVTLMISGKPLRHPDQKVDGRKCRPNLAMKKSLRKLINLFSQNKKGGYRYYDDRRHPNGWVNLTAAEIRRFCGGLTEREYKDTFRDLAKARVVLRYRQYNDEHRGVHLWFYLDAKVLQEVVAKVVAERKSSVKVIDPVKMKVQVTIQEGAGSSEEEPGSEPGPRDEKVPPLYVQRENSSSGSLADEYLPSSIEGSLSSSGRDMNNDSLAAPPPGVQYISPGAGKLDLLKSKPVAAAAMPPLADAMTREPRQAVEAVEAESEIDPDTPDASSAKPGPVLKTVEMEIDVDPDIPAIIQLLSEHFQLSADQTHTPAFLNKLHALSYGPDERTRLTAANLKNYLNYISWNPGFISEQMPDGETKDYTTISDVNYFLRCWRNIMLIMWQNQNKAGYQAHHYSNAPQRIVDGVRAQADLLLKDQQGNELRDYNFKYKSGQKPLAPVVYTLVYYRRGDFEQAKAWIPEVKKLMSQTPALYIGLDQTPELGEFMDLLDLTWTERRFYSERHREIAAQYAAEVRWEKQ